LEQPRLELDWSGNERQIRGREIGQPFRVVEDRHDKLLGAVWGQ
jgi:hypothetical protein